MKANELRIGNIIHEHWFTPNEDVVKIVDTYILICVQAPKSDLDLGEYRPIPLTEEWLLKCGFEKRDLFTFYKDKLLIRIKNPLDKFDPNGRVYWNSWTISEKQPEHLHQLQNLYFALTGEELNIEL